MQRVVPSRSSPTPRLDDCSFVGFPKTLTINWWVVVQAPLSIHAWLCLDGSPAPSRLSFSLRLRLILCASVTSSNAAPSSRNMLCFCRCLCTLEGCSLAAVVLPALGSVEPVSSLEPRQADAADVGCPSNSLDTATGAESARLEQRQHSHCNGWRPTPSVCLQAICRA